MPNFPDFFSDCFKENRPKFENGATNRPMKIEATRLMTIAILSFVNKSGKNGQSFSGKNKNKNILSFFFLGARRVVDFRWNKKQKTEARHLNFKFLIFPFIFFFKLIFFFNFPRSSFVAKTGKLSKSAAVIFFKILKNWKRVAAILFGNSVKNLYFKNWIKLHRKIGKIHQKMCQTWLELIKIFRDFSSIF